ncbi:MAG: hypothetical protein GSR85_10110 [Desulfurococcales archaeon]|nr:hypothetical protein [Desulfurococcales archaeon]
MNKDTATRVDCPKPNTHPLGFMILSFILSLFWLKINNIPVIPLGFILAILVAFWHRDIERTIYNRDYLPEMTGISILGAFIGFLINLNMFLFPS